jgi:hypothetical protein
VGFFLLRSIYNKKSYEKSYKTNWIRFDWPC